MRPTATTLPPTGPRVAPASANAPATAPAARPPAPALDDAAGLLRLSGYTDGWELGTGLPESLPPGEYAVTGRRLTPHGLLVQVVGRYHVRLPLPAVHAVTYTNEDVPSPVYAGV